MTDDGSSGRLLAATVLLVCAAAPRAVGHDLAAPTEVQAAFDGTFRYTAVFTADAPLEVAGEGYDVLENVEPPGMHGDGFCLPHVAAGETVSIDVSGSLVDVRRPGLVDAWFAPCGGSTLRVRTKIDAPGGPRRFTVVGRSPVSEVRVDSLVPKGHRFEGSGTLTVAGSGNVPLRVRLRRRARGFAYRMRSTGTAPPRAAVRLDVAKDGRTVRRARIAVKVAGAPRIVVRNASAVVVQPEAP